MDRSDDTGRDLPGQPGPPASVREVMSQPRRYQRSRGVQPVSRGRKPAGSGRPMPARVQPPLQTAREAAQGVPDASLSREIEVDKEKWIVRVIGTTRVGTGTDAGPRLLHLTFKAPGDRPNPERTVYVLARGIDEIPEEELAGVVADVQRSPDKVSGPGKGRARNTSRTRSFRRGRPGRESTRP